VLVTDFNMPQMSGVELISHVRSLYPWISIIAMGGAYHGNAVPAGLIADRFYPKGQHPHHLLTTIAGLIELNPVRGNVDEGSMCPELDS
jgi:CheY-like chemotaxis protein